jgi:hypothetical protein
MLLHELKTQRRFCDYENPKEGAVRRMLWTAALAAVVGIGVAVPATASPWRVAAEAGVKSGKETKVRFSTVTINNKEVLRLGETKDLHADERAAKVQERLEMVLKPDPGAKFQPVKASDVTVESVDKAVVLRLRNQNVVQVTPADAKLAGMSAEDLAQQWAEGLRGALKDVKVAQNGQLPANFIAVAKGEMSTQGGGAGGTPPKKDKQKDQPMEQKKQ